ncbi:ABC transporter permease [Bordetella holmesii]|uniref:Transport permease protein n=2 Tax=Bordetella holmesii TaxID=35814 RepID=A0A158M8Q7_9BORD|nr:ABC transporter permease [Bordetella holmesii]AHV92772.1 ABC-2 type transporter family protein [Bordetella holmesii ATCC 51541]AIT26242.1 ABC-2 type transporter family protein [Bordetella holmesii 44057]EWM42091.1 ABC-2 type transporter family protein [Bordetella holmesii 41130]EWM46813.1 ABC-2 type transporter family protein [Bordetella holmesii 35009]EWM50982.1 ABC-2 type transporter family protein [Bordetella holmesii 70147]
MSSSEPLVQPRLDAGSGFPTLLRKELLRFWKVGFQTIAAPVITAVLYLLVFAHVLEGRMMVYGSVPYTAFLIPGLMMMSMLQNAFANPSSSLIQSRITGNLVFVLLPPLSHREIFAAYVIAAIARGMAVGVCVWLVAMFFVPLVPVQPLWVLVFAVLACGIMAVLGVVAGLCSEKFDQLAAFQNFLVMPATFLSGVFYSIHTLPPFWQAVSHWNPLFYTIDGFRHGFFGISDVSPWQSLAVVAGVFVVLSLFALRLLARGYKLRN